MVLRIVLSLAFLALAAALWKKGVFRDVRLEVRDRTAVVLFIFFAALFILLKLNRHAALETAAYDLSAFDYAYRNTLEGRFLYTPFFGKNYLQEHFFPSMLLLLPFYAVHQAPVTLLVLQALLVSAASLPFFFMARRLPLPALPALVLTAAFMLNPFLLRGLEFGFHPEMIAPLALVLLFYFYLKDNRAGFIAALLVFLFTKENEWITGLALSLVLFLLDRRKRFAVPALVISVAAGLFIMLYVNVHYTRAFGQYMARYGQYGDTPLQAAAYLLTHPWRLLTANTGIQSLKLLIPVSFLPLLTPVSLAALPDFCMHMLSGKRHQLGLLLYYSAPVITLLFIASAFAYARLRQRAPSRPVWLLLIPVIVMNAGYIRFKEVTPEHRAARALCRMIPENVSVGADNTLIPHLRRQREVTCFLGPDLGRFDYLLVKTMRPSMGADAVKDGLFEEMKSAGGFTLYRNRESR